MAQELDTVHHCHISYPPIRQPEHYHGCMHALGLLTFKNIQVAYSLYMQKGASTLQRHSVTESFLGH